MYLLNFLNHPSFKKNKIKIIINLIKLSFLTIFKLRIKYKIYLAETNFLFNFIPLGKQAGSRGIYIYRENYEPLLKYSYKLIKENDVVLDIGANQGIYSIAFSKLTGPQGKVIAIEPFAEMNEILKKNIITNSLNNIKIFQCVVSDNVGYEFLDTSKGIVSSSIVKKFSDKNVLKIKSITIDDVAKGYTNISLIKLDIEGAELKALNGAKETLDKWRPTLSVEIDQDTFDEINNFLKGYGYKPYIFDDNGNLNVVQNVNYSYPNMIFKT